MDFQDGVFSILNAVVISGAHFKRVMARIEVGKSNISPIAEQLHRVVKVFQLIGIAIF